jgi:hypothetical protein
MRITGMDIHRVAAEAVGRLEGHITKLGRIPMTRDSLEAFARKELTKLQAIGCRQSLGLLALFANRSRRGSLDSLMSQMSHHGIFS